MAVEVLTTRNRGGVLATEKYEKGTDVLVNDGHLAVLSGGSTIAVYVPADWRNAKVVDAAD